jgi:hypothetical protein
MPVNKKVVNVNLDQSQDLSISIEALNEEQVKVAEAHVIKEIRKFSVILGEIKDEREKEAIEKTRRIMTDVAVALEKTDEAKKELENITKALEHSAALGKMHTTTDEKLMHLQAAVKQNAKRKKDLELEIKHLTETWDEKVMKKLHASSEYAMDKETGVDTLQYTAAMNVQVRFQALGRAISEFSVHAAKKTWHAVETAFKAVRKGIYGFVHAMIDGVKSKIEKHKEAKAQVAIVEKATKEAEKAEKEAADREKAEQTRIDKIFADRESKRETENRQVFIE